MKMPAVYCGHFHYRYCCLWIFFYSNCPRL